MNGMTILGAVIGGLALLGIIIAYSWGEAKTPGWGWKKQIENPNATGEGELDQTVQQGSAQGQNSVQTPSAAQSPAQSPEEELNQAVEETSRERQGTVSR